MNYDHKKIEKKWQKEWEAQKTYKTFSSKTAKGKKPYYVLDMFPYPSGAGLHVGHPRGYIGSDVLARKKRMEGFNVLHPMGYDAFGLPAEQYAIQNNIHPRAAVLKNVKTFEKQLSVIGLSYDWSRAVNTTDPEYYKWTQWIFEQIYDSWFDTEKQKARPIAELEKLFAKRGNGAIPAWNSSKKIFSAAEWKSMNALLKQNVLMDYRLAYEGYSEVNWCPELGTVLANDEIVDGPNGPVSERGGHPVEKKKMRQWFMRITAYGERLLDGLETIDWPAHIKEIQKNWIGKSEGSEIEFKIVFDSTEKTGNIPIFTTRADTLFGATYMVLAPEHPWVTRAIDDEHIGVLKNRDEVKEYVVEAKKKDEMIRIAADKEKTGVELKGVRAVNPANGESIPIWIADYVLPHYGTGAVMAVPAHDERDFAFAKKYDLPSRQVIAPMVVDMEHPPIPGKKDTKRDIIHAIVKHPTDDTFMALHWKKFPWKTFITGGIENGETAIEAAEREIREETGYKNMRFVKRLPYLVYAQFYAAHKDVNRSVLTNVLFFELENLDKDEISEEENAIHEIVWTDMDKIHTLGPVSELAHIVSWIKNGDRPYTGDGILLDSGKFSGISSDEARQKITQAVGGKIVTKYKFRDAVFARQRYWGEPIPLRKNTEGIIHEVPEKKLPLMLPPVKNYQPTGTGESPLSGVSAWTKAGYETNTMPGWAGSSWYFLRYVDPKNKKAFADKKELAYWFPKKHVGGVDMYVGGAEHATGHLLYSRFWHKVLFDLGQVPTPEPFQRLRNQGIILAADGRKMSKRWGNVVNPDDIVNTYGADTLRLYEMFIGPFEASQPWQTESIIGSRRFLERVWRVQAKTNSKKQTTKSFSYETVLHQTIKKVTDDIENFGFNTAVSSLMICLNEMEKAEAIAEADFKKFLQLLAPFAPHIAEELWHALGGASGKLSASKKSIHVSGWPNYDPKKLVSETMTIMIQVNGKVRGQISVGKSVGQSEIESLARKEERVMPHLAGTQTKKVIYVPGRLINFVV